MIRVSYRLFACMLFLLSPLAYAPEGEFLNPEETGEPAGGRERGPEVTGPTTPPTEAQPETPESTGLPSEEQPSTEGPVVTLPEGAAEATTPPTIPVDSPLALYLRTGKRDVSVMTRDLRIFAEEHPSEFVETITPTVIGSMDEARLKAVTDAIITNGRDEDIGLLTSKTAQAMADMLVGSEQAVEKVSNPAEITATAAQESVQTEASKAGAIVGAFSNIISALSESRLAQLPLDLLDSARTAFDVALTRLKTALQVINRVSRSRGFYNALRDQIVNLETMQEKLTRFQRALEKVYAARQSRAPQ